MIIWYLLDYQIIRKYLKIATLPREVNISYMHLLTFLLLQQQDASTQRFGPGAQTHRGPGPLCVEAFCCWSCWSSKNISKCIWNLWVSRPGAIYLGHSWQRGIRKVGPVPLVGGTDFQKIHPNFGDFNETKKMRDVRTSRFHQVSRRDLCYVSENEGFRFP